MVKFVRLACLMCAASVYPEPGSSSLVNLSFLTLYKLFYFLNLLVRYILFLLKELPLRFIL